MSNNPRNTPYYQKIDNWLMEHSGCSIRDYCHKFKYNPLVLKVVELKDDQKTVQSALRKDAELKELYIRFSRNKDATARKGDRTWTHFFHDLIAGWVIEDLSIEMLRYQGVDIVHNGRDAQRVLDIGKNISNEADCVVTVGNSKRKVELSNEMNTFLSEFGYIEKRAPAMYNLWKDKVIWLYRELKTGKYVLVDFAVEPVTAHLRYHKEWGNDAHRYVLAENGKSMREDRLLAAELIAVVGCGIDGKEQPVFQEVVDETLPPQKWEIGGVRKGRKPQEVKKDIPPPVPVEENVEEEPPTADSDALATLEEKVVSIAVEEQETQVQLPQLDDDGETADSDFGDYQFVSPDMGEFV